MPASSRYCGNSLDDALVERDRGLQPDREVVARVGVGARALLVERREAEHRVGRVLRVRVRPAVLRDELLEAPDRLLARVAQALLLDRDLVVERREDAAALVLVVELDDARDRAAVVARRLLVGVRLLLELLERGELLRASARGAAARPCAPPWGPGSRRRRRPRTADAAGGGAAGTAGAEAEAIAGRGRADAGAAFGRAAARGLGSGCESAPGATPMPTARLATSASASRGLRLLITCPPRPCRRCRRGPR